MRVALWALCRMHLPRPGRIDRSPLSSFLMCVSCASRCRLRCERMHRLLFWTPWARPYGSLYPPFTIHVTVTDDNGTAENSLYVALDANGWCQ